MAQEEVQTFAESVRALNRGDWEGVVGLCDEEIEFHAQRSPVQGVYRGHEGLRRFWADTQETFDLFRGEYPDVRDLGDGVLAIGKLTVRGTGSGVEAQVPTAILTRYRDGKISYFKDYVEEKLALDGIERGDGLPG
jgi:ketosteroid isomerase-like protein